jgi:hypothetical protein
MTEPRPYPSDLSDARWALIEPVLTAWRAERRSSALDIGRPPEQAHLIRISGVIEENEHPPTGQQMPIEPELLFDGGGYLVVRWLEAPQQDSHSLRRCHRRGAGAEPTQVHVELAVGKPITYLVSPVHGE